MNEFEDDDSEAVNAFPSSEDEDDYYVECESEGGINGEQDNTDLKTLLTTPSAQSGTSPLGELHTHSTD